MRGDQSLGLRAQLLVVAATLRQMICPRLSLKLQGFVEQSIQFFPSLRLHSYCRVIRCRSRGGEVSPNTRNTARSSTGIIGGEKTLAAVSARRSSQSASS